QEEAPYSILTQFCHFFGIFRYNNLPTLLKNERKTLKILYQNNVAQNVFYSTRLLNEYSLREYWVEFPEKISSKKLNRILSILPTTVTFKSETSQYLWTRLRSEDIELLKILKTNITEIAMEQRPERISMEYYDKKNQRWKKPLLIS
ncbi:MAG: hypothetical protein ACTSPV_10875, partial [Candidatus Hodarchaeales archaeon]